MPPLIQTLTFFILTGELIELSAFSRYHWTAYQGIHPAKGRKIVSEEWPFDGETHLPSSLKFELHLPFMGHQEVSNHQFSQKPF